MTDRATKVVNDESFVSDDWAVGYTKFECPKDTYAMGYTFRENVLSSLLCVTAKRGWAVREESTLLMGRLMGMRNGGAPCRSRLHNEVINKVQPAAIFCRR